MKKFLFSLTILVLSNSALFSQFNWQHTNGPEGGAAGYTYYNDDYAFYSDEYYLYRTADGLSWEQLDESGIWPMATNENTLVGQFMPDNTFNFTDPVTLKISYDHGSTWTEINKPEGFVYTTRMALCSHGIYLLNSTENFIYRSQDEGLTWDTLNSPTTYIYEITNYDDRLYAGLWRTDTNGENWEEVNSPFPNGVTSNLYVSGENIFVGAENELWYSNDDGQNWNAHSTPWPDQYVEFIMVDDIVYGTGGSTSLAKSEDFGASWEELPVQESFNNNILSLGTAGGYMLGATTNKGFVRLDTNTDSLILSNTGLQSASIHDLNIDNNNDIWAGTGTGVFKLNEQQGWNTGFPLPLPKNQYHIIETGDNGLICAAEIYANHFYLSTDYGNSWQLITLDPNNFISFDNLKVIDNSIYLFSDTGFGFFWRSDDLGATWTFINILGVDDIVKFNGVYFVEDLLSIYASNDQGQNWSLHHDFSPGFILSLHKVEDYLLAGVVNETNGINTSRLYRSQDGINWSYAHDGLPDVEFFQDVYKTSFFEHEGIYMFYNTRAGFYTSLDSCQSWLPVSNIRFHEMALLDTTFYAGGNGGGVISSGLPDMYGTLASGVVYKDDNNNGIQDGGETVLSNIRVGTYNSNTFAPFHSITTQEDGSYVLGIFEDLDDTLKVLTNHTYIEQVNPEYHLASGGGSSFDFGIYLTPDINDLSIQGLHLGRPRPGFDLNIYIPYSNEGTVTSEPTVTLKLDPNLDFQSAIPPPSEIIGDSLVWDIGQLAFLESGGVHVQINVPVNAVLGDSVKSTARIFSSETDQTPEDNVFTICDTIVGSYDPNDKIVHPENGLTEEEIIAGAEIYYTIRFQNTGTFLAEKVRITDQIDTALNLTTLRLVAASHDISSFEVRPGGLLEIIFNQINLPDSLSNEPESHGFVTFAIQRNKHFNINDEVKNMAAIYFDFNEPIFTNEVCFKIPEGIVISTDEISTSKNHKLIVFPNPAGKQFTISIAGKLKGEGMLRVSDTSGKVILSQQVASLSEVITVYTDEIPPGLYFIQVSGKEGTASGKVVVME